MSSFELLRDPQMQPGMRWLQVAPRGGGATITLVTRFDSMPAGSTAAWSPPLVQACPDLGAAGVAAFRRPTRDLRVRRTRRPRGRWCAPATRR
jgi:hypothetical protein